MSFCSQSGRPRKNESPEEDISIKALLRNLLVLLIPALQYFSFSAQAETTVTLSPIVVAGSSADALNYDPIVPSIEMNTTPSSASGSVARSMEESLPTPFTDYGVPGMTTQFRGIGRTSDDTNVQSLGVPLNSIQGGGFDFGSFPQFIWSKFSYHLGPGSGAFDPGAPSGTLNLTPWTAQAILNPDRTSQSSFRLTELVTRGLNQTSVAASAGGVAVLAGYSVMNAQGPSGSFSAVLLKDSDWDIRAHLLATSLTETSPGSNTEPTPNARFQTARWIPVLQVNRSVKSLLGLDVGSSAELRETLFYDRAQVRFVNPDDRTYDSFTRSNQLGTETALLMGDWTMGASLRRASYENIGYEAPDEWILHTQLSRILQTGALTWNAIAHLDSVSQVGFRPGGDFGVRWDLTDQSDVFTKLSFSDRFPSFEDRYEQIPYFTANPGLAPEQALSENLGVEYHTRSLKTSLQGYFQWRNQAQIYTGTTVINEGQAQEFSLLQDVAWQTQPWLDLTHAFRLSHSRVGATQSRIPYDPVVTEVMTIKAHGLGEQRFWETSLSLRALSSSLSGYGSGSGVAGGYGFVDFGATLNFSRIMIQGRIEDLMNRPIEVVQGYPWPGRIYALSLVGSI